MQLKVVIERGEDGYFVAHCPVLKSCWSQGTTRAGALSNIREAIALYLEDEPADSDLDAALEAEVVEVAI